jgi:NTE family protein
MKPRGISLALQGGGSYGAFTWGVLDRLLEDGRTEIRGVSGASAGAINAALLAHGLTIGGRQGARRALAEFWGNVAGTVPGSLVEPLVFLARFLSPSQFNPFNLNPVRDILAAQIDFARLRTACELPLFISATNVRTGMPRLFRTAEITADVLLASTCLPSLQRTVEIDGEAYWDGGLSANPPVRPLLYECDAADIVLVLLQPDRRPEVPVTAQDIAARWTELSFSSVLFSELDGILLAKREAERSAVSIGSLERRLRRLKLHHICAPEAMNRMSMLSRLNTHGSFMAALFEAGRTRADAWLCRVAGKLAGHGQVEQGVAAPARQ